MENGHHKSQELPKVLVLKPASHSTLLGDHQPSKKFMFLKPWESQLPLDQFLAAHEGGSGRPPVQALLSIGGAPVTVDVLRLLPALRLVVTHTVGVNHIDMAECRRRGVAVTNAGNVLAEDVADLAVGLFLDVMRRVSAADRFVRKGLWKVEGDYALGSKLGGKRVGIVGLGTIGTQIAKRLAAFGCTISYTSRTKKQNSDNNIINSYTFYSNVHDLALNTDALIICCPLTDGTRHMINRHVMLALGKGGAIVNVGRGAVVDEAAMVRCLAAGEIGGAGLDVFEDEPNVPEELFGLDNVVLSPHRGVFTLEGSRDVGEVLVGNLEAFFDNLPLLTQV